MTSAAWPRRASRAEDAIRGVVLRVLRRRGWTPLAVPYVGYGTGGRVRVLCRVLLSPPGTDPGSTATAEGARGWRRFLSAAVGGVTVTVDVGGHRSTTVSGRGGYVDIVVDADPAPGPQVALLTTDGVVTKAPVIVVGPDATVGLVSDIDDTVMITALPRPLLAFWNTFVRQESSRRPVPGMARLYQEIVDRNPDVFVVYLSTGPWNVAPALTAFLARHGFPAGPLLMTDWGPSPQGWFRSGSEHKRTELRRLMTDLPHLSWILVGDDGQHDPALYREAADEHPDQVRVVALRQLSPSEQLLTHGGPAPLPEHPPGGGTAPPPPGPRVPEVRAPDGQQLLVALQRSGVLRP